MLRCLTLATSTAFLEHNYMITVRLSFFRPFELWKVKAVLL